MKNSPVYERIFDQDDEIELSLDDVEEDLDSNYEEPTIKYALCHHHKGFDTIDLNVLMNPTIVGEFGGESSLAGTIFPEHHYEVIYFEGTFPVDNYERVESEFEKLLKSGATVKMVENSDGCFVDSEVIYVAGKGWTDTGLYYIEDTKRKAELIRDGNYEIEIWQEDDLFSIVP
ncbi:MAG: hypothetical protein AB8G05_25975 [Oligoflexales bacterium]